jgi:hypothetical protein
MRFCAAVFLAVLTPLSVRAELPPLSKEQLEAESALVVTGVVTHIQAGSTESRPGGVEYPYDLTVHVGRIEKGELAPGASVVARGKYIELKPHHTGSAGHYAFGTWDRVPAVRSGWEITFYLKPVAEGVYEIVMPNGFVVHTRTPADPPDERLFSPAGGSPGLVWFAVVGVVVAAALFACLCRYRTRNKRA